MGQEPLGLGHRLQTYKGTNMKMHIFKCDPAPFEQMWCGIKTAELRLNDRDYQQGDSVLVREHFRKDDKYTGRTIQANITYVTDYPNSLKPGHVMLCLCGPKHWTFKVNGETIGKFGI